MSTTTLIILINVGIVLLAVISYVIINLLRKNEKFEEMIEMQNQYIETISNLMRESDKKVKEIDSKQIFQSDDEIGWFFTGIKEIQELINEYNIKK
jgi:sortase (surface protein transpeptidase)